MAPTDNAKKAPLRTALAWERGLSSIPFAKQGSAYSLGLFSGTLVGTYS